MSARFSLRARRGAPDASMLIHTVTRWVGPLPPRGTRQALSCANTWRRSGTPAPDQAAARTIPYADVGAQRRQHDGYRETSALLGILLGNRVGSTARPRGPVE